MRQNAWGHKKLIQKPPIIIAQIETQKGIENIQSIVSYGFDLYMIGPYDLSASLGIPEDFENDVYMKAVKEVQENVPRHQMAVHIPTDVKNQIKKYENYGMIAVGMDTTGLLEFYKDMINHAKF